MSPDAHHRAPRVLIVEDDAAFATRLAKNLKLDNFETAIAHDVEAALAALADQSFDLVLADIRMPVRSGLELIDEIQKMDDGVEGGRPAVAVLTSINDIPTIVDAIRRGALDYLTKETTREELTLRLRNILSRSRLENENRRLRRSLDRYLDLGEIVGASRAIGAVKTSIAEIAPSSVTVLVTGETGVGKELVARAIHRGSTCAKGPFIEVNCAALPDENLFLSELFGHERGAFTGAVTRKRGQFELADGGTLFLDEVGELGPMAQARLLRAVETQQFHRVGGERPIQVSSRLIFATNKELEREVESGAFRRDLYYRINVFPIEVPPLRARPEDVEPLALFFATDLAKKHHLQPVSFAEDALQALKSNPWPGNVRELRNVIERLSIRFGGKSVRAADLRDLDLTPTDSAAGGFVLPAGGVNLLDVERSLVRQALQRAEWSQRRAAELLGISSDRMNARVRKFGFSHPSWRKHKD